MTSATNQPENIEFKPKRDKIIESILHLLHKCGDLTRYQIVKMIYLADKEHLNRYGRPITYDQMVAMEYGPVPSETYNILTKGKFIPFSSKKLPFEFIKKEDYNFITSPQREANKRKMSKSDINILDEIAKKYGDKDFNYLYNLTHEHMAYKNAWSNKGKKNSKEMLFEDMIDDSPDKEAIVEELLAVCSHIR